MRKVSPLIAVVLVAVAVLACSCPAPAAPSTEVLQPTIQPTSRPTTQPTAQATNPPTLAGPFLGDTRTRSADGMVMVYVPAGEFQMGSTEGDSNEQPVHAVALDGFWIDRTEVTNAQYAQCVAAGACEPPSRAQPIHSPGFPYYDGNGDYADYPVVYVNWGAATAYCEWARARLPTEAEWEYAARGPERREYPWGDVFDEMRLNYCDTNCEFLWRDGEYDDGYPYTAPVGSYPGGTSWCGALDMAGNVAEWVADRYGDYPAERQVNPTGPSSGGVRVVRDGSWRDTRVVAHCAHRSGLNPADPYDSIGFRCVVLPGE